MKPKLIVMVGISGSGKSTFANGLKTSLNATVVETDAIRAELFGDANDQSQGFRVFALAKKRVAELLDQGKNVVIDATSLTRRDRKDWINMARGHAASPEAYVVKTDVATAKRQNLKRARNVPEFVIDRQAAKFTIPTKDEGFDNVTIV